MQTKHLYKQKNLKKFEMITTAIVGVLSVFLIMIQKDWQCGELNEDQTKYQILFSNGSDYSQVLWCVGTVKNVFQS